MDPFNHNDTNPLRSTDLMIAYLEDRAGEEDVLNIESLLESDELYRLSMESLADQIADNREQAKTRIQQTEIGFEEALEAAKTSFIKQIEPATEVSDQSKAPGQAIPWWTYVIAIALIGSLAWIFLSLQKDPEFHKNPLENLAVIDDNAHASAFLSDCEGAGIGRPKSSSVYSALVEQFAEGNYEAAARQFQELSPNLSNPCKAYASFYEGQSLMASQKLKEAEKAFEAVLGGTETSAALKHAALWYLGNLKLSRGAYDEAQAHFSALAASADQAKTSHIQELVENGYLLDTQQYLNAF